MKLTARNSLIMPDFLLNDILFASCYARMYVFAMPELQLTMYWLLTSWIP